MVNFIYINFVYSDCIPNLTREIIVLFIILSFVLNYSLQINYLVKTYLYFKKILKSIYYFFLLVIYFLLIIVFFL